MARVRDYLAWEIVREDIKKQQKDGNVDPARAQTLQINIDKARGRIPEAIKQAYCIVVTVSEKDEVQAFKITVNDEPHFITIKGDKRSRVKDTAVTAEALLPEGPYNLWRAGETSRRVKDLAGAFAQLPHLPKMFKASAILDTLADGCEQGTFVLRLVRPDGTLRTWWMSRPDENALKDSALELVLPQGAELRDLGPALLVPGILPGLWSAETITMQAVADYFNGSTLVQVERQGYKEPMPIPKAGYAVVEKAVSSAVEGGSLWLLSGPASILGEPIPPGVLNPSARLSAPPPPIPPAEILPENLPNAWKDGIASALSIATALSVKMGKTLPWKTLRDVVSGALQARFLELAQGPQAWPCDFPSAQFARFTVATGAAVAGTGGRGVSDIVLGTILVASGELTPSQVQDLGDIVPKLLEIKTKAGTLVRFHIRIEVGDGEARPAEEVAREINALLQRISETLDLR
jgi:hypothetical protein